MHPLSEGGTPAGKEGGEGASREGRRGERGRAGEGMGNQPVFQQFRKKFEKNMRKDLEGTDKNLYLCIRFRPEKSINDERLTMNERARGKKDGGGVEGSISSLRY